MRHLLLPCFTVLTLAACGGGGEDPAAATEQAADTPVGCNTAAYQAGAVAAPSATDLAAYTGTYQGAEGHFDNGGKFVKTADATLVFDGTASLSYRGKAYTVSSICIDKAAGTFGRLVYVLVGSAGSFDIGAAVASADLGQAWGVSPADGSTMFQQGLKR